jgi:hypothetical protein
MTISKLPAEQIDLLALALADVPLRRAARTISWLARLARGHPVLVALDADDDPAKGEWASAWWCDTLKSVAYRCGWHTSSTSRFGIAREQIDPQDIGGCVREFEGA